MVVVVVVGSLVAGACSDDNAGTSAGSSAPPPTAAATTSAAPTATPVTDPAPARADSQTLSAVRAALDGAVSPTCDPLDTTRCYLPYPSNAATVEDPSSRTGRRVAFDAAGLPANADGVHVDPAEWNRNDGFSPNSTLLVRVPDLDPEASSLPPWTDLAASLADSSPVVLVDVDTGERMPLWAEPDAKAESPDEQLLVIHPAVSLAEGHTFVVGLRNLVATDGSPIEAGPVFRVYRDGLLTDIDAIEQRRPAMDTALEALVRAGVERSELVLAWDFTVASTENITGRALQMRDTALAELADRAPEFRVTEVVEAPEAGIARLVRGSYTVPSFLTGDGSPGSRLHYDVDTAVEPDAVPTLNGTVESPFACIVSDVTLSGSEPARISYYGHGLLGSEMEVDAGNVVDFANEHNVVFCATKWAGMSEDDVANAIATLQDFSGFATMADRMLQGLVNQLVLGRLMRHEGGLVTHPAFQRDDGSPLYDASTLAYDGNSQGGIMGMALAALSTDIERAVLGVVGMNYSILLPRSVDFDDYELVMVPAYPNALDRTFLVSLVQMLWDRGEGAGYVQHLVDDPLPGTPAKEVLLHVAFGDWQVTELSAYVAARTMGIGIHRPVTADGRSAEVEPGWGLDTVTYPSEGSALVVWDSGSDPIPFENVPPRSSRDPHSDPRRDPDVRRQKAAFLFEGTLIDVCDAGPCTADVSG